MGRAPKVHVSCPTWKNLNVQNYMVGHQFHDIKRFISTNLMTWDCINILIQYIGLFIYQRKRRVKTLRDRLHLHENSKKKRKKRKRIKKFYDRESS